MKNSIKRIQSESLLSSLLSARILRKANKAYQYIALAALALSFAACTQEDDYTPQGNQKDAPLAIASAGVAELTTRATINNNNLEGGSIGVYVNSETGGRYSGDNIKWTYGNDGWQLEDATVVLYEHNGEKQQIAAYYPYNENLGTGNVYSITLPEAYGEDYENYDYLYGEYAQLSDNPATIALNHLMAKVTVNIQATGTEIGGDNVKSISLMNVPRTADWTLPGSTLTNYGTNANIALYVDGSSYIGYALPNEDATSLALRIEMNSERIFTATASLGAALASGKHYIIGMKVGKDKAEISSVSIQPWTEAGTLDDGEAKEVIPSIDGTPYTSVSELQAAVKDKLSQEGATSVTIDGYLSDGMHAAVISAISEVKTEGAVTNGNLMAGSVTYTTYSTFADAVAGWTDNTILTLLGDATCSENIELTAKGLTLDQNGCTLTSTVDNWRIILDFASAAELTIRDSKGDGYIHGTVVAHGNISTKSYSTLILESGKVRDVLVNGNFTMTGGLLISDDSVGGDGYPLLSNGPDSKILVTGGEIYGSKRAVYMTTGSITITGTAKVSGGTEIFYFSERCVATVTGGTFSHDPSAYVDTENYTVTPNEDGTWSVTAKE